MDERYSIEVSDDCVLIYGHLSIEEAFDFLNFFDKKGFKSIDLGVDSSTLRFRRKSIEESEQEIREAEHKSSEAFYEGLYEESKKQVEKLGQKIRQLENFIKELMQTEQEKYARLAKENEANRRTQMLINLKDNPEVQKVLENFITGGTGKVVEDFRPFDMEKKDENSGTGEGSEKDHGDKSPCDQSTIQSV